MNRDELLDIARSIQGNAEIMQRFLFDDALTDLGPVSVTAELLGRCNILDAKIAAIRQLLATELSGRPDGDVHVLSDRGADDLGGAA